MTCNDENGQSIMMPDDANEIRARSTMSAALALQIAMRCVAREIDNGSDNAYTHDELRQAYVWVGDMLAQRGCEDLMKDRVGYLTQLIDLIVAG